MSMTFQGNGLLREREGRREAGRDGEKLLRRIPT